MNLDLGLTVVVISMAIFYIRLIQIRGKRRREMREEQLALMRAGGKKKAGAQLTSPGDRPMFQVASWVLAIGGVVLMLIGLAIRTSNLFPEEVLPYWWVVTAGGVLMFTFSFK